MSGPLEKTGVTNIFKHMRIPKHKRNDLWKGKMNRILNKITAGSHQIN